MISRQNKISIVSQGGLTSPKLFYQGPDFPNRSRKRWKERHVRISCTNVTNTLSSVVIISHPNQLQYCRTRKISGSQVLQLCFTESVADISRCKYVTSSGNCITVANMSHCCTNVTVSKMSLLQDPPTMENDPPTWELVDPTWELVDPTWELVLTPRWKQTRVIRITKGEDDD